MPRDRGYALTEEQELFVRRYKAFLVGSRGFEPDSIYSYANGFQNMLGHGFNWPRFAANQDDAWDEGLMWLAHRRETSTIDGHNHHVRVLNTLAEMCRYGLRFKFTRAKPKRKKANKPEERRVALTYKSKRRQKTIRSRALVMFSQEVGARRSATWRLHERDLDPINSQIYIPEPGKGGDPGWVPVRRSLWNPDQWFGKWLSIRPRAEDDPGWIWTTDYGGKARRIARGTMTQEMLDIQHATGVKINYVTGRHTANTETATSPGGDVLVSKERSRHTKLETTMGYIDTPPEWVAGKYRKIRRPPLVPEKQRDKTTKNERKRK